LIGRFHAGVNPISAEVTAGGFTNDVFDDAMREYEFEAQAACEDAEKDCEDAEKDCEDAEKDCEDAEEDAADAED
jgi:hypothetical protein